MNKEEKLNDHRSCIDRNITVGTLAYIDRSVISHTPSNTRSSDGNPCGVSRDPVVGGKITRIKASLPGSTSSGIRRRGATATHERISPEPLFMMNGLGKFSSRVAITPKRTSIMPTNSLSTKDSALCRSRQRFARLKLPVCGRLSPPLRRHIDTIVMPGAGNPLLILFRAP